MIGLKDRELAVVTMGLSDYQFITEHYPFNVQWIMDMNYQSDTVANLAQLSVCECITTTKRQYRKWRSLEENQNVAIIYQHDNQFNAPTVSWLLEVCGGGGAGGRCPYQGGL